MSLYIVIIDVLTVLGWLVSAVMCLSAASVCLFAIQDSMHRERIAGGEPLCVPELSTFGPIVLLMFGLAAYDWWICLSHVMAAVI